MAQIELRSMTENIDLRCTVGGKVLHIDKNTLGQNADHSGFHCMAVDRSRPGYKDDHSLGVLYVVYIHVMSNETVADLYNEGNEKK